MVVPSPHTHSKLRRQGGYSIASVMFYVAISSVVISFLYPLINPQEIDIEAERQRIETETEENTIRELALRYGMTLSDLESHDFGNPWGTQGGRKYDENGNPVLQKTLGATGLFGRPLTPTYGALLGGRSDMEPIYGRGINPKAKRDRNLWPLNTDYDLYSLGADGKTSRLLSSPESQDDIIRANNGQFIGLASDY